MRRKLAGLLWAIVSLSLIAGCVPIPPERPATAQADVIAPVTAIPQPTLGVVGVHPSSTRTGIAEVDRAIDAFLSGNGDSVRGLLQILSTPCTTREGLGGPPKCNPGEGEGTIVQAFPVGGPEGHFVSPAELDRLPVEVSGLYAVYRVPAGAYREDYWPAGNYGVIFLRGDMSFLTALVTGDGIVRLDYPAANSPTDLEQLIGNPEMVLPPAGS